MPAATWARLGGEGSANLRERKHSDLALGMRTSRLECQTRAPDKSNLNGDLGQSTQKLCKLLMDFALDLENVCLPAHALQSVTLYFGR